MKAGKTLNELAVEVKRQREEKRDFVGSSLALEMVPPRTPLTAGIDNGVELKVGKNGDSVRFAINDLAHEQIADRLEIPRRYYERLRGNAQELLSDNVNHWFRAKPEKRMVRTLDNRVRAFLSDRYRPLDNFDLAEAVLPDLLGTPGLRVESSEITERRFYLKVVNERVQGEVKKGDVVQAGMVISNSEVGAGSLSIQPMVFRLVCLNGAIMNDGSLRKYHAGKATGGGGDEMLPWERLSDEARKATDAALWLQIRDLARAALDDAIFRGALTKMQDAAGQKLVAGPTEVIDVMDRRFGLREGEKKGILSALIEGADLSRWGVANALTAASQKIADYDRATEMERLGGQIIELEPNAWRLISEAKN
jgi:hypothetical protein